MPRKHYTPPLSRFLVCALHHEAKARGIPMTRLAQQLVEAGLKDTPGWKVAEAQREAAQLGEGVTECKVRYPRFSQRKASMGMPWSSGAFVRLQKDFFG